MRPATTATRSSSIRWIWLALLAFLLAVRLPSLVEPAGGDQGLYLYSGQRVLAGGTMYKDAWDQKPPGIASLYAVLWRIWPHESVVPGADLLAAAAVAALLVLLGRRRFSESIGLGAAALFLLLGDPSLQRNSGVYVRGQCEPFIGLAVVAALALLAAADRRPWHAVAAGMCLAASFWIKYNAITYGLAAALALWAWAPDARRSVRALAADFAWVGLGFGSVLVAVCAYFAWRGALVDLYLATITYNLRYSGEMYSSVAGLLAYPVAMPLKRAQVDLLWYLGGIGSLLLIRDVRSTRSAVVVFGWLVAAILSIQINGRDLPNYFVQANAPLALAAVAGLATLAWRGAVVRAAVAILLVAGLWRVGTEPARRVRLGGLPGLAENVGFDLDRIRGKLDRAAYLGRFKGQKFDALEIDDLARDFRALPSSDPVYVFGFAGGSICWKSERVSASRFFWSRPVIIEFEAGRPGYGSAGLLADLQRRPPSVVVLQKEEWRSQAFFLGNRPLRAWLEAGYVPDRESAMFAVWRRRPSANRIGGEL
ncbi:MAG: hypothetical protein ACM3NQ_14750 [Bacteroidales bacterium]